MEPRHERIARIALAAGGRYGLALAGGYAVSAHGMGSRPSGDVDLFTSWQRRGEFPELAAAVIAALESAGYKASVIMDRKTRKAVDRGKSTTQKWNQPCARQPRVCADFHRACV